MAALCMQVPDCIWSRALFDGAVKVDGFDVSFENAPFDQRTSRRLRGEVEEKYAGAEQVLTDYIVRLARGGIKASEMIQKLGAGELDAVIYPGGAGGHWFNWLVESGASRTPDPYGDLEQMVAASSNLAFPIGDPAVQVAWFKKTKIYPTYHCLAVRKSVAENNQGLAAALVAAFDRAAKEAPRYMNAEERNLYEREQELLNVDPNACGLNDLHKRTAEKCIDILAADGLLPRRVTAREIFAI